jgi:hypothetical protein
VVLTANAGTGDHAAEMLTTNLAEPKKSPHRCRIPLNTFDGTVPAAAVTGLLGPGPNASKRSDVSAPARQRTPQPNPRGASGTCWAVLLLPL